MEQDLPIEEQSAPAQLTEATKPAVKPAASGTSESGSAYAKAVALGLAVAIVASLVYSAVDIVVGTVIAMREHSGYFAAVLGLLIIKLVGPAAALLIGKAMMLGSGRRGGLKYQVVAALLTYVAITMAEVPVLFWQFHLQGQNVTHATFGLVTAMIEYGLTSPLIGLQDLTSGVIGLLFLLGSMGLAWWTTAAPRAAKAA